MLVEIARSLPAQGPAAALFAGAEYLALLWVFWIAPLFGGVVGGLLARYLLDERSER